MPLLRRELPAEIVFIERKVYFSMYKSDMFTKGSVTEKESNYNMQVLLSTPIWVLSQILFYGASFGIDRGCTRLTYGSLRRAARSRSRTERCSSFGVMRITSPLWCCDQLFRRTGDMQWLGRLYPKAAAYLR